MVVQASMEAEQPNKNKNFLLVYPEEQSAFLGLIARGIFMGLDGVSPIRMRMKPLITYFLIVDSLNFFGNLRSVF